MTTSAAKEFITGSQMIQESQAWRNNFQDEFPIHYALDLIAALERTAAHFAQEELRGDANQIELILRTLLKDTPLAQRVTIIKYTSVYCSPDNPDTTVWGDYCVSLEAGLTEEHQKTGHYLLKIYPLVRR